MTDVRDAYEALQSSDRVAQYFRSGYLDVSQKNRDISEYAYQRGAASLLDFLDAERSYRATQLAWRQTIAAYLTALEQVRQAVGTRSLPYSPTAMSGEDSRAHRGDRHQPRRSVAAGSSTVTSRRPEPSRLTSGNMGTPTCRVVTKRLRRPQKDCGLILCACASSQSLYADTERRWIWVVRSYSSPCCWLH